jgi:hypothetical protein
VAARVAEPYTLQAGHALAQQRGQLNLDGIGGGESSAAGRLPADRLHDLRVRVAEDHGRVIAEHVDALGTVRIPDAAALAALDVERIGVEIGGRTRGATRHHSDRAVVERL